MKESLIKWHSPHLGKDMEMLVFGHDGLPVVIFPTTMGRFYEAKDFLLIESVRWYVENGLVTLYCPDSINDLSWYDKGIHPKTKVENHIWYDKMVHEEIVNPLRSKRKNGKIAVAGCSFGGYHAVNYAFRHPEAVSHLISMSGSFDIKSFLDGYYDENVYFNNPIDFIPNLNHPDIYQMKIVLGTAEHDQCKGSNIQLSEILNKKGISHWLDIKPNANHDWPVWRDMFPHYLSQL